MALAPDARFDTLADAAERFADGCVSWDEMKAVRRVIKAVRKELGEEFGPNEARHDILKALDRAAGKTPLDACWDAAAKARYAFGASRRPDFDAGCATEQQEQLALARDIFGNPFRQVTFDARWRTTDVLGLAGAIYEDRAFDRMPLLADALMDAGCADEELIGHCRGPGPHVRGCWVVDLLFGKT